MHVYTKALLTKTKSWNLINDLFLHFSWSLWTNSTVP